MSRVLKFRAWDKDRGEMIPASELCFHEYVSVEDHFMDEGKLFMQFTGLLDKNGVEIYEGDILDFDEAEWGGRFPPEAVPEIDRIIGQWPMSGSVCDVGQWRQVIGNIHEHPELLEQQ